MDTLFGRPRGIYTEAEDIGDSKEDEGHLPGLQKSLTKRLTDSHVLTEGQEDHYPNTGTHQSIRLKLFYNY